MLIDPLKSINTQQTILVMVVSAVIAAITTVTMPEVKAETQTIPWIAITVVRVIRLRIVHDPRRGFDVCCCRWHVTARNRLNRRICRRSQHDGNDTIGNFGILHSQDVLCGQRCTVTLRPCFEHFLCHTAL